MNTFINKCIIFSSMLNRLSRRVYSTPSHTIHDVLVVGGGHAGCEAATAAARMGVQTLLLTHKLNTIGEMSCNPSFGGIGKGHLMREIDALDGICPRICDKTGINYRVLNRSKGPAVWGLRAQIDRDMYKLEMQKEINDTKGLTVTSAAVEDLIVEGVGPGRPRVVGVQLDNGMRILSHTVIITTGTFLRGEIFLGLERRPAGRVDDDASYGLSKTLDTLGFRLGRLRTGTPPRLDGRTIDYSRLEKLEGDEKPVPFSFLSDKIWMNPEEQVPCYFTETNDEVGSLCRQYIHLNKHVLEEVNGPRYCPSLESKIIKFSKNRHQVIIEPEGLSSHLKYPQGMSMTFPADIQQRIVNKMKGFENTVMVKPGYGVQYDFVDPKQLKRNLETKIVDGLFLAGQINGTTGYEEAAAQGILAGINSAAKVQSKAPLILDRTNSYIGVLVDDLTSVGTVEPYRMFTSRAEFRLYLRPDNADIRLTKLGYSMGAVSLDRYTRFSAFEDEFEECKQTLESIDLSRSAWKGLLPNLGKNMSDSGANKTALQLMSIYDVSLMQLVMALPQELAHIKHIYNEDLEMRLKIQSLYANSIEEMKEEMNEVREQASLELPEDMNYLNMECISSECRQKLMQCQPQTLGAASRIPGMTPTSLLNLLRIVKKNNMNLTY